jgi:hypothetical protein
MAWHGMLTHIQGSLDSEPRDASGHASINSWLALATATSGSAGVRECGEVVHKARAYSQYSYRCWCAGVHEWSPCPPPGQPTGPVET